MKWLAPLAVGVALIVGCGGSRESGGDPTSAVDRANAQAEREQEICFKQADRVAAAEGVDAGGDYLNRCVEQYTNSLQVQ